MLGKNRCVICQAIDFGAVFKTSEYVLSKCLSCKTIRTNLLDKKFGISTTLYSSQIQAKKHLLLQRSEFLQFARNTMDHVEHKSGILLDVGCGFGWVVAEAGRRGFEAIGIDPSRTYTDLGKKNLKVKLLNIALENYRTRTKFDVIVLNHVLEHTRDPLSFLKKIHYLLKPRGELLVLCPNIQSLMFMVFKSRWYGLQPAQHLTQFTPASLSKIIEKSGLKEVKAFTTSLYYNPPGRLKKMAFIVLTNLGEIFGLGDQVVVNAKKVG